MHKEAYPTFLNFETELDNLEMGQDPGESEIIGAMEMIPRIVDGICFVFRPSLHKLATISIETHALPLLSKTRVQ